MGASRPCKGVRTNLRQALENGEDPVEDMGVGVIVCPDTMGTAQATTGFCRAEPIDAAKVRHSGLAGMLSDCIRTGKSALTKVLVTAVAVQVDVIVCDANLFIGTTFRSGDRLRPYYIF